MRTKRMSHIPHHKASKKRATSPSHLPPGEGQMQGYAGSIGKDEH